MSRFCFAAIVTGMLLPSMLFPPPADALYDNPPGIGEALNYHPSVLS